MVYCKWYHERSHVRHDLFVAHSSIIMTHFQVFSVPTQAPYNRRISPSQPMFRSEDPSQFSEEIFNFQRLTLAPILIISGFVMGVFAIMYKSKK